LARKPHFTDVENYAIGMAIEVIAICVMMAVALFIGFLLVSWY